MYYNNDHRERLQNVADIRNNIREIMQDGMLTCTVDFSSVDTNIPFRNHTFHIIVPVHNFIWRVWLRNGIIVSTELKSVPGTRMRMRRYD